jgi:hypothetical protein
MDSRQGTQSHSRKTDFTDRRVMPPDTGPRFLFLVSAAHTQTACHSPICQGDVQVPLGGTFPVLVLTFLSRAMAHCANGRAVLQFYTVPSWGSQFVGSVMRTVVSHMIAPIQSTVVLHVIVSPIGLIMAHQEKRIAPKALFYASAPHLTRRVVVLRVPLSVRQMEEVPERRWR